MEIALKVKELVKEPIEQNGYMLDEVVYELEGNNYFLRIIIDKPGYITVDDCVTVTKIVNPILDESNMIEDNYILDVCSKEKGCD